MQYRWRDVSSANGVINECIRVKARHVKYSIFKEKVQRKTCFCHNTATPNVSAIQLNVSKKRAVSIGLLAYVLLYHEQCTQIQRLVFAVFRKVHPKVCVLT